MSAGEPVLTLFSDSLLSKFGFNDGDEPDEFWDYREEHGIDMAQASWHRILTELVKRLLVPALEQHVEIAVIEASHNPVRARTVDGKDAERYWNGKHDAGAPALTPEWIEIPMAEVARIAVELARAQ